ncbi:MAG: hypothetical protein U1E65_33840 [Myxococcota bacterium]
MRLRLFPLCLLSSACGAAGGGPGGAPILADPVTSKYACTEAQAMRDLHPPFWGRTHGLAAMGAGMLLGRVETDDPFGLPASQRLIVSAVTATGAMENRFVRTYSSTNTVSFLGLAATDRAWALAFAENFRLQILLSDGGTIVQRDLSERVEELQQAQILARPEGWLLVWASAYSTQNPATIWALTLDAQGHPVGGAQPIFTQPEHGYPLRFGLAAGGLLIAEQSAQGWALRFLAQQNSGAWSAPALVRSYATQAASFAASSPALLADGDGFVAAWSESTPFGAETTSAIVWLAKLDAAGAVIAGPRPLTERTESVEDVEPELFAFRGDTGLLWSRGAVIYICGGCVPDHDLRLVILSSALHPLSTVLPLPFAGTGGLLSHTAAAAGPSIAIASNIQLHVTYQPALGFARCD